MAAVVTPYLNGYLAIVTINGNTYAKSKAFELPDSEARTIKTFHNGGLQITPDGRASFGMVRVTIPQDGSANLVDTLLSALVVVIPAQPATGGIIHTWTAAASSAYVTKDSGGKVERGNTVDRVIEVELNADGVWS